MGRSQRRQRRQRNEMATRMFNSTRRIFSGIQPTGVAHIGNYVGAIDNWVKMANANHGSDEKRHKECLFCVVDLHSLTAMPKGPKLREDVRNMAATLIASGLTPEKCTLFVQSQVPHHAELAWMLSCTTPVSWLSKMTQYKTKSETIGTTLGLFAYPVLMAADILLYRATEIPVGDDQTQHLELARAIGHRFNKVHDTRFPLPRAVYANSTRIMSLRDPSVKMSKSDLNQKA